MSLLTDVQKHVERKDGGSVDRTEESCIKGKHGEVELGKENGERFKRDGRMCADQVLTWLKLSVGACCITSVFFITH